MNNINKKKKYIQKNVQFLLLLSFLYVISDFCAVKISYVVDSFFSSFLCNNLVFQISALLCLVEKDILFNHVEYRLVCSLKETNKRTNTATYFIFSPFLSTAISSVLFFWVTQFPQVTKVQLKRMNFFDFVHYEK